MRNVVWALIAVIAASCPSVYAASDSSAAISHCRSSHSGDAQGHIACLESALQGTLVVADDRAAAEKPTGIGSKNVEARLRASGELQRTSKPGKERERAEVRITEVVYTRSGAAMLFTDDGQIWREIRDGRPGQVLSTKKQYTGEITESLLGGYRLDLKGVTRSLKVERLK